MPSVRGGGGGGGRAGLQGDLERALAGSGGVPWALLDEACTELRARGGGGGPYLHELLRGAPLELPGPPPPRSRSAALEATLRSLREREDNARYAEMVRDVVPPPPAEPLSVYAEQVGFGLNVILMMFTLFMVGYFGAQGFSASPAVQLGAGLCGASGALLLETALLILRFNRPKGRAPPAARTAAPKRKAE